MIITSRERALMVADGLMRSGRLPRDDVQMIRGWLGSLAAEHAEPKRDLRKLRASEQFGRSRVRNEAGGSGIGQSAMLAYAASRNLVVRRDDVRRILTYFNRRTIAVEPYITDARTIIGRAWCTCKDAWTKDGKCLRVSHRAVHELAEALMIYVEPFAPFVECAVRAVASLHTLNDVLRASGPRARSVPGHIEDVMHMIRRMRMIAFIEDDVVSRLVFADGGMREKGMIELDRMIDRLERMVPREYRTLPRNEVLALALNARDAINEDRFGLAAKRLKNATHLLATQF